jgi:hypothetical protein
MIARARVLIALTACVLTLLAATAHANIVYIFNTTSTSANPTGNPLQTDTVLGTITTDGTLGILASSNILSWNLNLIDGLNAANNFLLTPANSEVVHVLGNALSATATDLYFNFSMSGAEFLIQGDLRGNSKHPISSGWNYFCFSATGGWCLAGETIAPQYVYNDGVIVTGAAAPIGQQPLDQGQHAISEPSILGLVALGLLCLGGNLRRKFQA